MKLQPLMTMRGGLRQPFDGVGVVPMEDALIWEQRCLGRVMKSRAAARGIKAAVSDKKVEWTGE
jgi:hypothetical protein